MTRLFRTVIAIGLSIFVLPAAGQDITVGSKKFTESVILGEIAGHILRDAGIPMTHRRELGGTRVLWEALKKGDIDIYPEYSGTIAQELLKGTDTHTVSLMRAALAKHGIRMTAPMGFNNTYAVGVMKETAVRYGIAKLSDLRVHAEFSLGFSNEFLDRGDGWPALRQKYRLPQRNVRGLDHDLAYRGLASGSIDGIDVYTTDAEIAYYDLVLLKDDLRHFPTYNAVYLYRADLDNGARGAVAALSRIEGRIDAARMSAMNGDVKLRKQSEGKVAAGFVESELNIAATTEEAGFIRRLWLTTRDHLVLVGISLGAAILVAIPLGIAAARFSRVGQVILGAVAIVQTIPSLALFVFMIPILGIGGPPAIVALFLYSLLPIVRNTHAGLRGIDPAVLEAANAIGLSASARLRIVELPLALRSIMAGIKTSAVINVGTATLGALIGAGGYGQPILTGIRLDDVGLILEGAVPAAALALIAQGLFELAERAVVPRGLRRRSAA